MADQQLFTKIFKTTKEDIDIPFYLKNITEQHPYFGLAYFYTLKNSVPNTAAYNEIAAKTALFYTSKFYLQAKLINKNTTNNVEQPTEDHQPVLALPDEIVKEDKPQVEKDEILFEPLHASDYFASQGIKLSEEALGADKLGKQLKSFTAWLKTMKKVHPDKLAAVTAITETAVQTQAEKSNIEEEIVTEPMAEAYILQNKTAKAVDIYNKLSLLNPAKSAYFAAKIDSLKK